MGASFSPSSAFLSLLFPLSPSSVFPAFAMSSLFGTSAHVLVVGGTQGIGRAIAVQIANAAPGTQVIIAGRSVENTKKEFENEKTITHGNVRFEKVDCGSLKDVKRMCAHVAETRKEGNKKLDALIMSPGIMTMNGLTLTEDNLDFKMSLHYYSRMLVIRELIRLECLTANATIMSVLDGRNSDATSKSINWDDMALLQPGSFGLAKCATHCLAFTDIQLSWFAKQAGSEQRTFVHAYPGIVKTNIGANFSPVLRWVMGLLSWVAATDVKVCAQNLIAGLSAAKEKQKIDNKNYWNIGADGKIIKKTEVDDTIREKVKKHTWDAVDKLS